MPKIDEIMQKKSSKPFKKREYRSWNIEGEDTTNPQKEDKKEATNIQSDNVVNTLSPSLIKKWKYSDRTEFSLGNITGLANEFKQIGQLQPCIVRPDPDNDGFYELIIGERRWRAAKEANIDLLVIIKNYTDAEAGLAQAAENDNREDLSDYEKGRSFSELIENKVFKQKDLIEKLGRSKQYVSALLSFTKIPEEIQEAFGDMNTISASTAEKIKQLANKGNDYIDALVQVANRYRGKSPGPKLIEREVQKTLNNKELKKTLNRKVFTEDGRHIFTWRNDNNQLPSIHFPKQIGQLLLEDKINFEELSSNFMEALEMKLKLLKKSG